MENSIIGKCPKCGGDVVTLPGKYACQCGFALWKSQLPQSISESQIKKLLIKGKTGLIKGIPDKNGGEFQAKLCFNDDYSLGFERNSKKLIIIPAAVGLIFVAGFVYFSFFNSAEVFDSEEVDEFESTTSEFAEIETETTAESEIPATIPPPTNAAVSDPPLSSESSSVTATSTTTSELTTATTAEITTATAITAPPPKLSTSPTTTTATPKLTTSTTTVTTPKLTTSTTATTTPKPIPPAMPTSLRIVANANNIEFSWGVVDGADGYEVSRSIMQIGGYSAVNSPTIRDGGRVRISDSSAKSGTTYYYSVRAFKNVGNERIYSDYSEVVSVTAR